MKTFRDCVTAQLRQHPSMQPQDLLKLCYQAANGGDHLLTDLAGATDCFWAEFQIVSPTDEPLYEPISDDYMRVNLGAWKRAELPGEWLLRLFLKGSGVKCSLIAYLNVVDALNFPGWQDARCAYTAQGMPAVHHSDGYRQQEQPAYRVVSRTYEGCLSILQKTAGLAGGVIAIDGRAAAGKSTLARRLGDVLDAPVIAMDDFFLPPALRTKDRLAEVGGNIHYERFQTEVLPDLRRGTAFAYRQFDCGCMDYLATPKQIPAGKWRIVEGSYSHHPRFSDYAALKVFVTVDARTQVSRILARNGAEMAARFQREWIPMEETYFTHFQILKKADVVC